MPRVRGERGAPALFDVPTRDELRVRHAGERLSRKFASWVLVTSPPPPPIMAALHPVEADAIGALWGTDWFRWFLEGWESVRDAQGSSEGDW